MLENLHDRTEASYLVTELCNAIVEEETDVISKLAIHPAHRLYAKDTVAVEDAQQLSLLMLDPNAAKYFKGAQFSLTMVHTFGVPTRTLKDIFRLSCPTLRPAVLSLLTHFLEFVSRVCFT